MEQSQSTVTGQMEYSPRSLHTRDPLTDWRKLTSFVITEDDLAVAITNRAKCDFNPETECLVATALRRMGYSVECCGYRAIQIDGYWREACRDTGNLVSAYLYGGELRNYLPFVALLGSDSSTGQMKQI